MIQLIKHLGRTLLLSLVLLGISTAFAEPAQAAFDPGRIIDDGVFTNKNAMSVQQIQAFLNSKVTACDNWHAPGSGAQGEQPPWTCLKDYSEGGRSAAQIIFDAAQTYSINPQVIIVTLQKENGLITDSWPYNWQYRTAMGMGCPDGAPCDSQYYGFANQVNQGTRHLAGFYNQNPGWFIPYRPGVNYIKWHPNSACGGTNVNIVNRATASLYSYTPYQPNAAALNNMYGTGDGCSSYGNRNFWRDFTSWFGSTQTPSYASDLVSINHSKGTAQMVATEKQTITITVKNTGSATWTNSGSSPVTLATYDSSRPSKFYDPSWISNLRQAKLQESSVAPGQNGTFIFTVQASSTGEYWESFRLVAENLAWFSDGGYNVYFNVSAASFGAQYVSNTMPSFMQAEATATGTVTYKNTSNVTWYKTGNAPVKLGTYGQNSIFAHSSWERPDRLATISEDSVTPGSNATFSFTLKAPSNLNRATETYKPLVEGWTWIEAPFSKTIEVAGTYFASAAQPSNITMRTGETRSVTLSFTNTGSATWNKTDFPQIRLATAGPLGRSSAFATANWISASRPAAMNEDSVATNQTATFTFELKAPQSVGTYNEAFTLIAEGHRWIDVNSNLKITVAPETMAWQPLSQTYSINGGSTQSLALGSTIPADPGDIITLNLTAKNTGNSTWEKSGSFPARLGLWQQSSKLAYNWPYTNRPAGLNEATVAADANGTFTFTIRAPYPGSFSEAYNLLAEGNAWAADAGYSLSLNVRGDYGWQIISQSSTIGATTTNGSSVTMSPNAAGTLTVVAKNTGSVTWRNTGDFPMRLGTSSPLGRSSSFYTNGWPSTTRAANLQESSVAPGSNGTFVIPIRSPLVTGSYSERFNLISEGMIWFPDAGLNFNITVQ